MSFSVRVCKGENIPTCGDGCCSSDGLFIEKEDGFVFKEHFVPTISEDENKKILELLQFLYGRENVEFEND